MRWLHGFRMLVSRSHKVPRICHLACIVHSMAELWVIIERLHFPWLHYKRIFRVKVVLSTISFGFVDSFDVCRCWFDVHMHVFAYLFPSRFFCDYFRPEIWMTRLSGTSIWCQRSTTTIVLQISGIRLLSVFVGVIFLAFGFILIALSPCTPPLQLDDFT